MKEQQLDSIKNYSKAGIKIEVVNDEVILIRQERLINNYILTNKELYDRAKEIFPDKKIKPITFSLNLSTINSEWLIKKMNHFGIKSKDIIKQTGIKIEELNCILKGTKKLQSSYKSLFYYYFLCFEINKEIRCKK